MTRHKNHYTTLTLQSRKQGKAMFSMKPPLAERNKAIGRLNSGEAHAEMMAKVKEAAELKLAAERENYERSEKARLAKRDQELADTKFKTEVASKVRASQNELAAAIATRNLEAAKLAATELLIFERMQH